jgi:hypothetical protein
LLLSVIIRLEEVEAGERVRGGTKPPEYLYNVGDQCTNHPTFINTY